MQGRSRRILSLILSAVFLFIQIPTVALAETQRTAIVNGTEVQVRQGPSVNTAKLTDSGSVILLNTGHALTVYGDAVADSSGGTIPWYSVGFSYRGVSYRGYIRSDLCTINPPSPSQGTPNLSFEQQLALFPSDYQSALRTLHQQHPSWNFEAVPISLKWETVLSEENKLGKSLTDSRNTADYSTEAGSYDASTGTYFPLEGGRWYQAAPRLVAYYLDPRNFLNENDIFQFETLAYSSVLDENALAAAMRGTFMEGQTLLLPDGSSASYARAFQLAASTYNVSPLHLLSRCIQEVGRSGNAVVFGNYPGYVGYYNFFNIGAKTGATEGMAYAKSHGWSSPYTAIAAGAEFISDGYIAVGQNTPYFQKFSVVNPQYYFYHQYMTNIAAAYSEGHLQRAKYVELGYLELPFTFRIPYYDAMPDSSGQSQGGSTPQAPAILYGDPSGDGLIDAVDLLVIRRHLLGLSILQGVSVSAADVNRDGTIDAVDLLIVRRALLGLTTIQQ